MSANALCFNLFFPCRENRDGNSGLQFTPLFSRFSASGRFCPTTSVKAPIPNHTLAKKETNHDS
jgi:hypothetical protein